MSVLKWDQTGQKLYETGVDKGVLFVADSEAENGTGFADGVAWNGLTAVSESPEGAEPTDLYADNVKYLSLMSAETFKATIEAYTYPDQFGACDGSADIATGVQIGQQTRKSFALAYRTMIGSDDKGTDKGYKIHIIYGCVASPSDKQFSTINDSPEAITFSWEVSTTPVEVSGFKPTATVVIDSTKVPAAKMTLIENALYGTTSTESKLLMPQDIIDIINPTTPGAEDDQPQG